MLEELKDFVTAQGKAGQNVTVVGKAIRLLKAGSDGRLDTLEDFTFSQYRGLICSEANWPRFQSVFDTLRELVNADFADVNELRNVVFHFRRGITPKDTDRLRRFRDRLRYDRELYARDRAASPVATATRQAGLSA